MPSVTSKFLEREPKDMAQHLGALTALLKNPSSFPITYVGWFKLPVTVTLGPLTKSPGCCGHLHTSVVLIETDI